MRYFSLLLFALLFLFSADLQAQELKYDISLEPAKTGGKLKLEVKLEFTPWQGDTTPFRLPTVFTWSSNLQRCFRFIKAVEGGRIVQKDSITWAFVKKSGATKGVISYQVIQNFPGEQVTVETSFSPIILEDYIHIPAPCLFLVPANYYRYDNFDVTVNWTNIPPNWKIQNNINSGQTQQKFTSTKDVDWIRSVWVAGDFRLLKGEVFGKEVAFALRGKWVFSDETLMQMLLKTIETQREEWQDKDIPYYSATMIPFVSPNRGRVGNARTGLGLGYGQSNSFVIFADPLCPLKDLTNLFNHEMMHDWIGGKINIGQNPKLPGLRWLAEGFTEYMSLRNRWKNGFISDAAFMEELNEEVFNAHYSDPNSEAPNATVEKYFFRKPEYESIPYRRGAIIAFYYDLAIREKSNNEKTLLHFMRDLLELTNGTGRDIQENFGLFTETLGEYIGEDPASFLEKHATKGIRIAPEQFKNAELLNMKVTAVGVPKFSLNAGKAELFKKD